MYARRQWDLLDDRDGLHNQLLSFDQVRYYVMILCTTVVDCILFGVYLYQEMSNIFKTEMSKLNSNFFGSFKKSHSRMKSIVIVSLKDS